MASSPSPARLLAAYRTLSQLEDLIGLENVYDRDHRDVWDGLQAGRHALAVATSALADGGKDDDDEYAEVWREMIDG